jgi:hypothetical protein
MYLEKDEVPKLSIKNSDLDGELLNIPVDKNISLGDFFGSAVEKFGFKRLVDYDASTLNCQAFILDLLEANNLSSPTYEKWIMQNASQLLSNDKTVISALKKLTDLAALGSVFMEGGGIKNLNKAKLTDKQKLIISRLQQLPNMQSGAGVVDWIKSLFGPKTDYVRGDSGLNEWSKKYSNSTSANLQSDILSSVIKLLSGKGAMYGKGLQGEGIADVLKDIASKIKAGPEFIKILFNVLSGKDNIF